MPMDIVATADRLTAELASHAAEERAVNEKRYLNSEIDHLGVSVPIIRKAARQFVRAEQGMSKPELCALTNELWDRNVYELRKLAVNIIAGKVEVLDATDFDFIEGLLRQSHTWALIDDLSINVVHPMLIGESGTNPIRDRWATDDDFWVRRTAILSLLPGLRRGTDRWRAFTEYAEPMLSEEEFFIRKAIGWILREVSKHSPELVVEWLTPRAKIASSVTMREALKYLPEPDRAALNALR